jgi:hypothetical protein
LTEDSFASEDNSYYLERDLIKYRTSGIIEKLEFKNNNYIYSNNELKVSFSGDDFKIIDIKMNDNKIKNIKLDKAAEMIYLLSNLNNKSIFANHDNDELI